VPEIISRRHLVEPMELNKGILREPEICRIYWVLVCSADSMEGMSQTTIEMNMLECTLDTSIIPSTFFLQEGCQIIQTCKVKLQ